MRVQISEAGSFFVTDVLEERGWTLPYDRTTLCAHPQVTCSGQGPQRFISAGVQTQPPLLGFDGRRVIPEFAFKGPVDLPPAWGALTWDVPGLTLRFAPSATLTAAGSLSTTGTTFTASNPAQGWGGLRFESGAVGTLAGVTVSNVRTVQIDTPTAPAGRGSYPPGAAVRANNAAVTITDSSTVTGGPPNIGTPVPGGTVRGTNGVLATGGAVVTVTGSSTISFNGGLGIVSTGGAQVSVTGDAIVSENDLGGVLAAGYQSRATVTGYAAVDDNDGPGAQAFDRAHVEVRSPGTNLNNTSVSSNVGGLDARAGASIDARQCAPAGATGRPNNVSSNNQRGGLDAVAFGGSTVAGRRAYWDGRATLQTDRDGSSTVGVYPVATSLSSPDPLCPVPTSGRAAGGAHGAASALADGALDAGAPDAGRGTASASVVARAAEAREAAWLGDTDAAFAALTAAGEAAVTDDDREAVFEATAALLADVQPPGVVAALAAEAAGAGADAPWARRALVVAYATSGRAAEADALAAALAGDAESSHAVAGHALRVRLAVDAGDETRALARLSDLAGAAPEASEALGSALALVAAAFPAADLSGMTGSNVAGRSGGRGGAAGTSETATSAETSARGGTAADLGRSGEAVADGLAVSPNPLAGRGTVRVSLAAPAERAVVTVYDALGRRVAVLHDGPLGAGAQALSFESAALPAGVYVVHVRLDRESGAAWTDVRRVTVTR